jgi:hypothetical protein
MFPALPPIIVAVLIIIPLWRVFSRSGLNPAFSLFVLVPVIGVLIAAAILACSDWPAAKQRAEG